MRHRSDRACPVARRRRPRGPTRGGGSTTPTDHHSEYLAKTLAALTPEGRARVDELLDELAETAGAGRERLVRFAGDRRAEVDTARTDPAPEALTRKELDALMAGFMRIRDGEPLDDVADWGNAVLQLLQDEPRVE